MARSQSAEIQAEREQGTKRLEDEHEEGIKRLEGEREICAAILADERANRLYKSHLCSGQL